MKIIKVGYGKDSLTEIQETRKGKLKRIWCWHCEKQTETMFCLEGVGDGFFDEYLCTECIKKFALLSKE